MAGLKSGRVYIRTQGVGGPSLQFSAEWAGRVFEMGDTIPAGAPSAATLQVEVTGSGAQTLAWIRNGELLGAQSVNGGIQRRRVEVRDGDWFSVIIRDPAGQATVLSNAIYVRSK